MKVGYILASQHLTQLPSTLRTSVLSNCRSKIIFTLEHHEAKELASQAPELTFEDFMTLAPFHFYAQMPIFTITLVGLRAKPASFEKCSVN